MMAAPGCLRDKLLVSLLALAGLRIGQALEQGDIQRSASLFDVRSKIAHELADASASVPQELNQAG